jgi:hypothetical protein
VVVIQLIGDELSLVGQRLSQKVKISAGETKCIAFGDSTLLEFTDKGHSVLNKGTAFIYSDEKAVYVGEIFKWVLIGPTVFFASPV